MYDPPAGIAFKRGEMWTIGANTDKNPERKKKNASKVVCLENPHHLCSYTTKAPTNTTTTKKPKRPAAPAILVSSVFNNFLPQLGIDMNKICSAFESKNKLLLHPGLNKFESLI